MGIGWRTRVQEQLAELPSRALIRCSRKSGIDIICEATQSRGMPAVTLWFDRAVGEEQVLEALRASVARSLGSVFDQATQDLYTAVEILREYQLYVGPIRLIVGWAEELADYLGILGAASRGNSDFWVFCGDDEFSTEMVGLSECQLSGIALTLEEAIHEAGGRLSEIDVVSMFNSTGGQYVAFQSELFEALASFDDGNRLGPPKWAGSMSPEHVIDGLIGREMWGPAFDWCCKWRPARLADIITDVGDTFFNSGEHGYFFERLINCPSQIRDQPAIFYWLFAAASAIGQQWVLMPNARRILRTHDAPELRAAVAMAHPSMDMLAETTRAISDLESPVTLRAHGFALGLNGEHDMPLVMFREAMRLADMDSAHHLVVACGLDIAQLELRRGKYGESIAWARWAIAEMEKRRVRDFPRRLSAAAALAYAIVLTGDPSEAQATLSDVDALGNVTGAPGMEAIISTIGDVFLVNGDFVGAETMYRVHIERAPMEVSAFTALDLVALQLAQGNVREAREIADRARAISKAGSAQEQAIRRLLLGMVLVAESSIEADSVLCAAIDALKSSGTSVHVAQAAIWLSISRHCRNDTVGALDVLAAHTSYLDSLGDAGWRLLSARHESLAAVRTMYSSSRTVMKLQLLGGQAVVTSSGKTRLSNRTAEMLALLAHNPGGLTAERFHVMQFGDVGDASRIKVAVSRLRKQFPITASPYRLAFAFRADFVEVLQAIDRGDYQAALNMYDGPLLPASDAPAIVELRDYIEESLKQSILDARDSDALIQLGTILDDDLEIWLAARASLPQADYRQAAITARIRRIRANWQLV